MGETHELKTWPGPFAALVSGDKAFEVRRNDRDFNVGDRLLLREWDPEAGVYSGRAVRARVSYMTRGGEWGLPPDLCVIGLRDVEVSGG